MFSVPGIPIPQGSKRAYVVGRRAVLVDTNKAELRPWREKVTGIARIAHGERPAYDGPVRLACLFRFTRPKTVKREHMSVPPDLDKLTRAIGDSLTKARVFTDDARVVALDPVKVYGVTPGVQVVVTDVKEDERLVDQWLKRNEEGSKK